MSKFKVGDIVKLKFGGREIGNAFFVEPMREYLGQETIIVSVNKEGHYCVVSGNDWNWDEAHLEIIKSSKSNMNIINKFSQLFLKEPQKSFRKAGITDDTDMLTEDGQKVFLTWLLKQNEEKFNTEVVQPLLVEDKE